MSGMAGFDVNGLWDWAAVRETETGEILFKDGGVNSAAIRLVEHPETLVVGPQTVFAPHGRGPGWGMLGDAHSRIEISAALKALSVDAMEEDHEAALIALANELAADARFIVVAVTDDDSFNEGARDRFLHVLRRTRAPAVTLLWRTVAATLGWISQHERSSFAARGGLRVAVLSILRDNVHFGDLTLEVEKTGQGPLIVPVRRKSGRIAIPGFGGASLAHQTAEALAATTGVSAKDILRGSHSLWSVAVGKHQRSELFRQANRRWLVLSPPPVTNFPVPYGASDADVKLRLGKAEAILIEGAAAKVPAVVDSTLRALAISADDARLHRLEPCATARGCLEANERLRRDDPVYYDFLPQLKINALVQETPRFVSLIPKGERLRGGDVYRAQAPGQFALGAGASALTFYILKEDFKHPRKSEVELPEVSDQQHPIVVSVEQSPGQGYAKVRISSSSFMPLRERPLELDWTKMTVVKKDRKRILSELEREGRIAYPNAQIHRGHPVLWHPRFRFGDAASTLARYSQVDLIVGGRTSDDGRQALHDVKEMASKQISPSFEGARIDIEISDPEPARFLDSDGGVPESKPGFAVPKNASELLDRALQKAEKDYSDLLNISADASIVRDLLGFATWCHWRCPRSIVQNLIYWYEDGGRGRGGDLIVRLEGLGRILHESQDLRRFFSAIDHRLSNRPIRNPELAALARILGSCESAASELEPEQASRFLQATGALIAEQNEEIKDRAYKRKFKYALLMLASLLRHRKFRSDFLAPGQPDANKLIELLDTADKRINMWIPDFNRRGTRTRGRNRQKFFASAHRFGSIREVIEELRLFIHREGRDPNIIHRIGALEE